MCHRDIHPRNVRQPANDWQTVFRHGAQARRRALKNKRFIALDRLSNPPHQLLASAFRVLGKFRALEIRSGQQFPVGLLAKVQPIRKHQAVQNTRNGLRVSQQPRWRRQRKRTTQPRHEHRCCRAGRDNNFVRFDSLTICHKPQNPVIANVQTVDP